MRFWMLLLIPVIAFSIGCGKPIMMGTPIDKAKLEQLVPGKTPEGKLAEIFGQPDKKEMVSGGMTKYTYSYYEEHPRIFSKTEQIKQVLDVYTQKGTVLKYDLRKEGVEGK
jgi:hypothetical protein